MADVNVTGLSDSELRKSLKDLGQNVGPITKSTRNLWEKKLIKLLESSNENEEKKEKKTRRKSGRVTTAASNTTTSTRASTRTKTPSRSRNKKLAVFSSDDDEEDNSVDQLPTKSAQTSPIGFPSPEVSVLKDISPAAAKILKPVSVVSRKINISNDNQINGVSSMKGEGLTPRRKVLTNNNKSSDFSPRVQHPQRISEFSDDDFTELKSKRTNYSLLNGKGVSSRAANITLPKKTLSSTPTHILNRGSPSVTLEKSSINHDIRDEIDASLSQLRKSYTSKKPSPVFGKKKSFTNQQNESEEEDQEFEDEELDAEFASSFASFHAILKNKKILLYIFSAVVIALLAIGFYFYTEEKEGLLRITESNG